MVKLSQYSNSLDESQSELMPWHFWTEEERSQVIFQAYKDRYLTSKEVKHYLDVGRTHMFTQFLVPALAGVTYFSVLRDTVAASLYRKSPSIGNRAGVAFVGLVTIWWLNCSPFYLKKEKQQEKVLNGLYHKMGSAMKLMNDLIPRTRTSTDIDIRTRMLYSQRNGLLAGTLLPEEDYTPPLNVTKTTDIYEEKKKYL